jgi:transposase-like protein
MSSEPKTLQQAILYFAEPDNCLNYLAARRWPNGVVCPVCGRADVPFLANQRKWQCKSVHHHRQFSIKVGTIFEDSAIGLDKWLTAIWMLINCKNGISSYEVARALVVTQKTAWFMMHRSRLALQDGSAGKLGGEVEVDETFIGGKARNMHVAQRKRRITGTGGKDKAAVMGLLEAADKFVPSSSRIVASALSIPRSRSMSKLARPSTVTIFVLTMGWPASTPIRSSITQLPMSMERSIPTLWRISGPF